MLWNASIFVPEINLVFVLKCPMIPMWARCRVRTESPEGKGRAESDILSFNIAQESNMFAGVSVALRLSDRTRSDNRACQRAKT
jgi:hypothetical protein